MKTEDVIRTLVADAEPVRRLPAEATRCARWAAAASSIVVLGALALGPRPDLASKAGDTRFLGEAAALLVLFVVSARAVFRLSVPGEERSLGTTALPSAALLLWAVVLLHRAWPLGSTPGFDLSPGYRCVGRLLVLGISPAIIGFVLVRRAAPLKKAWTGALLGLASFSAAALGSRALCVIDRPEHVLLWHVLPVAVIASLGATLGAWIFDERA